MDGDGHPRRRDGSRTAKMRPKSYSGSSLGASSESPARVSSNQKPGGMRPSKRAVGGPKKEQRQNTVSESLALVVARLSKSDDIKVRQETRDQTKKKLEDAENVLASEIEKHHGMFYEALEAFQQVVGKIDDSKERIHALRFGLKECKTLLRLKRESVNRLMFERTEYAEMLRLLDQIEEIKMVPDKVGEMIQKGQYVPAASLLVKTTAALQGESLGAVKALHDLHRKLFERMKEMREVIIAEVQSRIYIKGHGLNTEASDSHEPSNPFGDLERGVEALGVLQFVPYLIETLKGTTKAELALVIEKAVAAAKKEMPAFDTRVGDQGPKILHNLLSNFLFERMWQVFVCHCHVLAGIRKTEGGLKALQSLGGEDSGSQLAYYSEESVWKSIQVELEIFLCTYLDLDENTIFSKNGMQDSGVPHASNSDQHANSAAITLFSFSNSLHAMTEQDAKTERAIAEGYSDSMLSTEVSHAKTDMSHKNMLCKKSFMNITGIYKPTVLFVGEMEKLVIDAKTNSVVSAAESNRIMGLQTFIDLFLKNKFVHDIVKKISKEFKDIGNEGDKPLDDHGIQGAPSILFKNTVSVHDIMRRLCWFFLDLPCVCAEFLSIMERILTQFKSTCQIKFKSHVKLKRGPSARTALSAGLESNEHLRRVMRASPWWKIYDEDELNLDHDYPPYPEEPRLILGLITASPKKEDVIFAMPKIKLLAYMHGSMHWFSSRLAGIAKFTQTNDNYGLAHFWQKGSCTVEIENEDELLGTSTPPSMISKARVENAENLLNLAKDFRTIAESCLMVLRFEVRVHCMHFLLPTLRSNKSNFYCTAEQIEEADPQVVSLCKDLLLFDEVLFGILGKSKYEMVVAGLGEFLAILLIRNVVHIKKINDMGIKRMCRSIFALQQTLRTISRPTCANALDKAMAYYELFNKDPAEVLEGIVINGKVFSQTEYRNLLTLAEASQTVPDERAHAEVLNQLELYFKEMV